MEEEKKEIKEEKKPVKKKLIALKDFVIVHNETKIEIKEGDVVDVPKMFLPNLKTEKVIK